MGLKRRIVMVLLLAVCMVVSTGQVSLAKRAIKTDVSLKGMITSDSAIELSWNAYPGASFYLVYRAPVYDGIRFGRYKHIGTAYGNSYVDGNVSRDNTYRYLLRFGVGKTSYKSKVKDVHVGIEAPRFLMARDGGDEFSSTDYNRITLVAAPGAGTIPDGILLQKKDVDGAFKALNAALEKSDNETLKANRDHLANNRVAHFSNTALGDQWYALLLEEPRIHQQRPRQQWR